MPTYLNMTPRFHSPCLLPSRRPVPPLCSRRRSPPHGVAVELEELQDVLGSVPQLAPLLGAKGVVGHQQGMTRSAWRGIERASERAREREREREREMGETFTCAPFICAAMFCALQGWHHYPPGGCLFNVTQGTETRREDRTEERRREGR